MAATKLIIFSAPSGTGKSTLINHLMACNLGLEFSVSATSRSPRGAEEHGKEYYFLSCDEFRTKIANNEFIEYEEVYCGCFYGTLRSEIDRIGAAGKHIIFDVDVVGGLNIKRQYPDNSLSLFIAPPSLATLEQRLRDRATDSLEMIEQRIAKAELELSYAPQFDRIIVNDDLATAQREVEEAIRQFLSN